MVPEDAIWILSQGAIKISYNLFSSAGRKGNFSSQFYRQGFGAIGASAKAIRQRPMDTGIGEEFSPPTKKRNLLSARILQHLRGKATFLVLYKENSSLSCNSHHDPGLPGMTMQYRPLHPILHVVRYPYHVWLLLPPHSRIPSKAVNPFQTTWTWKLDGDTVIVCSPSSWLGSEGKGQGQDVLGSSMADLSHWHQL